MTENDMFDPTCGGCVHFRPPTEEGIKAGVPMGTCWRYPPTALSIPVDSRAMSPIAKPATQPGGITGFATWPVRPPVAADTLACGEFEAPDDDEGIGVVGVRRREEKEPGQ